MLLAVPQKIIISILIIPYLFTPFLAEEVNTMSNSVNRNEYKAITYNIHGGKNKSGTSSLNEVTDLLKNEDADFIALQEVDKHMQRSGFKDQTKWLSEELNMEYVFGTNLNFGASEYGNAILSKYPILDWGQVNLAYETEPRSMLWAKVKTEKEIIYITSIHLGLDTEKRSEHFSIIEEFINIINEPILLMGDFNSLPSNQSFSQFRSRTTGKLVFEEIPTYINHQPIQIDYIIGKGIQEIKSYNIPANASDHYPLIMRFKISPNYQIEHRYTMS